jgi:large subunit ribosomal protein L31
MAKADSMHKNYRQIKVIMTNGEEFITRSTYHNDSLKLDIDIKTHPAWTNQSGYVNTRASEVSKFNDRYSGLGFMTKSSQNTEDK